MTKETPLKDVMNYTNLLWQTELIVILDGNKLIKNSAG
jgi:hypothetical protein